MGSSHGAAAFEHSGAAREIEALLREFAGTRDPALRDRLVLLHGGLVRHLASRFFGAAGTSREDLVQVGYLGVIAALDRFDPQQGLGFTAFAVPTIVGVLKSHLRDCTWAVKAPRRLRELGSSLPQRGAVLEATLGRCPTVAELAVAAGVTEEHLLRAMDVGCCRRASSLEAVLSAGADGYGPDGQGRDDPALAACEWREVLDDAMAHLPEPEQAVILQRFLGEASQYETARRLSMSRTEVARLERRGLARLRRLMR